MTNLKRPLFRSKKERMLTGLLGGVAEYLDMDVTMLRLIFVLVTAFTHVGPGILVYVIGSIIVPEKQK